MLTLEVGMKNTEYIMQGDYFNNTNNIAKEYLTGPSRWTVDRVEVNTYCNNSFIHGYTYLSCQTSTNYFSFH
jgi:hypothetical protein